MSRVETITHTVDDAVVDHPSFVLTLGKTGVFPNINRPRVLWVGVEGEVESLRILYDLVEDSLTNIGFTSEKRGFNPHLTVGRIRREGTSVSDIQTVTDALSSAPLPPRSNIEVRSVSLIKSTLLPTGAVYETLATMPLRGESP